MSGEAVQVLVDAIPRQQRWAGRSCGSIKQRAKEVADAQSAVTQLQALRQARVLQMLTPEQRVKLKEIRERAQATRQERQGANALAPRQQMRRNANAPLLTPEQRKALRQQQKKNKP